MPSSSCGVSRTSARIQRAGAPTASVRRSASSSIRGLKSTPTTSSAPEVPERQRVPAAGALEVDRPAAAAVEVADELELGGEQVRAAAPDQLDRLGQPALVALGCLVPGRAGSRRASPGRRPPRRGSPAGRARGRPLSAGASSQVWRPPALRRMLTPPDPPERDDGDHGDETPPEALLADYPEPMRRIADELRAIIRPSCPTPSSGSGSAGASSRTGTRVTPRRTVFCCCVTPEPKHVHIGFRSRLHARRRASPAGCRRDQAGALADVPAG